MSTIPQAAEVLAAGGTLAEAAATAFEAAKATGASSEQAAEVSGVVIGDSVLKRGGNM